MGICSHKLKLFKIIAFCWQGKNRTTASRHCPLLSIAQSMIARGSYILLAPIRKATATLENYSAVYRYPMHTHTHWANNTYRKYLWRRRHHHLRSRCVIVSSYINILYGISKVTIRQWDRENTGRLVYGNIIVVVVPVVIHSS